MLELLEGALAHGDWLELRFHDRRSRSILVEDGKLEAARSTHHAGVGVRALVNGAWGFASTSVLTKESLARAVESARKAAAAAARVTKHRVKIPSTTFARGTVRTP